MRSVPLYSALLLLGLFCGLAHLLTQTAQAAPATRTVRAAKASSLQGSIADFEALEKHASRASRRDLWLALEEDFAALAAKSKGDARANALLYHARAREALARRSFLSTDHREAAARFASFAARHPKHRAAPDSLYRQADILVNRLADEQAALPVLEALIAGYPKAGELSQAKKLLARIEAKSPQPEQARQGDTRQERGRTENAPALAAQRARSPGKAGVRSASVMEQLGLTVQTIMLDAGHGGNDPGARGAGVTEKNFTLSMVKRLGALLQKEGFTVLHTRSGDRRLPLEVRPDMANSKKADLFISVHFNANVKPEIRGLETYYLDEAKTQDAATVAARENGVPVKNISDLQVILTDLVLSSKVKESRHLADCVHKGILARVRASRYAAPDNGVRSAPFYVLVGARMPAILVEFGYISNQHDAANLKNEAYLQRQAEGLVQGIVSYKAELARIMPRSR